MESGPSVFDRIFDEEAWRLELEGDRLAWVTHENGKEVRLYKEPENSFWRRFTTRLISRVPIEKLL